MRIKRLLALPLLLTGLLSGGCSIHQLTHDDLQAVDTVASSEYTGSAVVLASSATGFTGGKVGWGRITPFAIPVAPVYIHGDEGKQMMDNIGEALTVAGHQTREVTAESDSTSPVLVCHVNKFRYSNYTYFAPIVPTWGKIDVTLQLQRSDGSIAWEQQFEGGGFTLNFTDGYNIAAKESMTELLNSMVDAFSGSDFKAALMASYETEPVATAATQ